MYLLFAVSISGEATMLWQWLPVGESAKGDTPSQGHGGGNEEQQV